MWFRLYAEFATDPKVQMLSEIDQRRYVMLLCLRCCNGCVTLPVTAIAFQLRISDAEFEITRKRLVDLNLIDGDCKPVAWEKRQFDSDTSNARVAKHREKKKQQCNVTVAEKKRRSNGPETETETEIETDSLSGKPDIQSGNSKKKLSEACTEVLEFLNEKTGRNYKPVPANINLIAARLKQGATVVECRQVIAKKCREWRDNPDQEIYLRPKTLFSATNFANYQGEIGQNE